MFLETRPLFFGPEGGRHLCWMAANYRREKDARWRELGEDDIQALSAAAVHVGDYCHFPGQGGAMPKGWDATFTGWDLQGAVQFYRATGYAPARQLASEIARFLKDHAEIFDSEGRFLARHDSVNGPVLHFHHNANTLIALGEYAAATGNTEYASFVQKGCNYTLTTGAPLVGFFPEYIGTQPDGRAFVDCEADCVRDIILLALLLMDAGWGDYWDDVDRYLRNQWAEMQMTSGEWLDIKTAGLPRSTPSPGESSDRTSWRQVGAFVGWVPPNDFYGGIDLIVHCCAGNAGRLLYTVWERMVKHAAASSGSTCSSTGRRSGPT